MKNLFVKYYNLDTSFKFIKFLKGVSLYLTYEYKDIDKFPDVFLTHQLFDKYYEPINNKLTKLAKTFEHNKKKYLVLLLWVNKYEHPFDNLIHYIFQTSYNDIIKNAKQEKKLYQETKQNFNKYYLQFKENTKNQDIPFKTMFFNNLKRNPYFDVLLFSKIKNKEKLKNELFEEEIFLLYKFFTFFA